MSVSPVFVGIDIGTSGLKVIAVTPDGEVAAARGRPYPIHTPEPGWVEQDPEDWWSRVASCLRALLDEVPGGPAAVAGVGLSGHMSSLVVLDAAGRPLRRCITVADGRGEEEAARLTAEFGPRLERLAGGQPGTSDVAPKLLWLKAHESGTYERMATFLFAKDFVRYRLTGRIATDPTDAGNTFFLDLRTRQWDLDLYRAMGLEPGHVPELVGPTEVAGTVTPEAAAATGLRAGTPVVAGGADMATSVVGTGVVRPGVVAITIGTSAQVTTAVADIPQGGGGRVSFHPHADPSLLYVMGSIFSGGLTLLWLAGAVGEAEELEAAGSRFFEGLSAEAALAPPGSDGAMFLPFLVGSGTPDFDPAIRGTFLGLSLDTRRPQLVRASLEGVAHNARECLAVLRDLGLPIDLVNLGGGGSASSVWRQIMAAATGRTVHPARRPDASALGAAALAAVGLGGHADVAAAAGAMVRFDQPLDPDPVAAERYARDHATYLAAKRALAPVYRGRRP